MKRSYDYLFARWIIIKLLADVSVKRNFKNNVNWKSSQAKNQNKKATVFKQKEDN